MVSSFQKGKMVSDKMTSLGDYEFGDLTGIGGYGIEAYPTLDGVPIIASAGSGEELRKSMMFCILLTLLHMFFITAMIT